MKKKPPVPFSFSDEDIDPGRIRRVTLASYAHTMSFNDVFSAWRDDAAFRSSFNHLLADMPFGAFFWEMRPVTMATADEIFEFVCVDSPALVGASPNPQPFATQLSDPALLNDGIATFANLGADAMLVAPCAAAAPSSYPHLAAFVRSAPAAQQDAFWQCVALAVLARLGTAPLWISTSGLGVYWLHVRLDAYPKYYTFAPYRR